MRKGLMLLAACLLFAISTLGQRAEAADRNVDRQALVIFVEGMSFADLSLLKHYPHVNRWLPEASYAALAIRSPGARNEANAYLLMGSGGQALYSAASGTAYNAGELVDEGMAAKDLLVSLGGADASGIAESAVLFPGIFRLQSDNSNKPYTARIGLMGSRLEEAGISVALYGNGDVANEKRRLAALFAMNGQGIITSGDVSNRSNVADKGAPYGIRTNYEYLLSRIKAERAGLVVVQLSDLSRLYRLRDSMRPEHFEQSRAETLSRIDRFLGELLKRRESHQLLMVTSPAVNPAAAREKSLLTPLLAWDGRATGELTSWTTRQSGIVSGLDVLPTILAWLRVPIPAELPGHQMKPSAGVAFGADSSVTVSSQQKESVEGEIASSFEQFLAQVQRIDSIFRNRPVVLYTYVMLQIAILLTATLVWVWQKRNARFAGKKLRRTVRLMLLAMLFFPAVFLLEPLINWTVPAPVVILAVTLLSWGGALLVERMPLAQLLCTVASVTVGAILLDGFLGAAAMKRSYLGYDPVIGARFYGLGNEYEGVLIGAAILAAASFYEWRHTLASGERQRMVCFLLAGTGLGLVLYYMAAPALGTDAGGFLAGAVGFGVAVFRLQSWRLGKKSLLLITVGLALGIALLMAVNLLSHQPPTHVGQVAEKIVTGDWAEVVQMIERKIEMNVRLIRVSVWSRVFVLSLFVAGLLMLRPGRYLRRLSAQYPFLVKGFSGVIAGSLAALVLNDSGIVSAATSIIFFVVPALYAILGEHPESRPST